MFMYCSTQCLQGEMLVRATPPWGRLAARTHIRHTLSAVIWMAVTLEEGEGSGQAWLHR